MNQRHFYVAPSQSKLSLEVQQIYYFASLNLPPQFQTLIVNDSAANEVFAEITWGHWSERLSEKFLEAVQRAATRTSTISSLALFNLLLTTHDIQIGGGLTQLWNVECLAVLIGGLHK